LMQLFMKGAMRMWVWIGYKIGFPLCIFGLCRDGSLRTVIFSISKEDLEQSMMDYAMFSLRNELVKTSEINKPEMRPGLH